MGAIDSISWRRFDKFLVSIGCEFKREKGDHRIYWRQGILRPLVVPRERILPVFIILNNLRVLGISKEEFLEKIAKIK
jgi:predicted RNA binding protein YcfA (HicA-like mRNA interferase family)